MDDIVVRLRRPPYGWMTDPSVCGQAADAIVRLRGRWAEADANADLAYADATRAESEAASWKARAERAEADADRLASEVRRLMCACGPHGYVCSKCAVLGLHDKEVEAR